ncbi:MAG: DUF2029 domain-containing protein [Candidatus Zixiibacteriota bacterium]|nr:MAG: DUF2029 domain-containing protein [candidate division Zixibacteria bacterium]
MPSILFVVFSERFENTSLGYAEHYVSFPAGTDRIELDSWRPMARALTHVKSAPEIPLYSQVFFDEHVKFQYPPSSLLIVDLLRAFPGMSWMKIIDSLSYLSWLSVLIIGVLTACILRRSFLVVTAKEAFPSSKANTAALYYVVLLIALTFYPITRSFYLGQIQTLIALLATVSLIAWQYEKKKLVGVLIGLICAFKPHWGLVILWGWMRKQWGMAIAGTVTVIVVGGISVSMYGINHHLDYMSVLSFLSKHGEAFFPNQSVNGLMNRLLFNGNNLNWSATNFPPYNPVVYWTTLISTILIIAAALMWRFRDRGGAGPTELAIIMLSVTIASPIAWEHHYAILLPILAVIVPIALSKRIFGRWTVAYLAAAFLLASQRIEIVNRLAETYFNFLQSYLFLAGIMVLVMLYAVSNRVAEEEEQEEESR